MTDQDNHSSEDSEEEPPSSRGQKGRKERSKSKFIKLIKLNKNLGKDEKETSVDKQGKVLHGKPQKIVGATQKFGELFFYVKFENKTKPVFVRAEENECIFWLLIGNLRFFRELNRIFIYLFNL